MLFRHLDAMVPKENRYSVNRNAGQQQLHSESVAKHVRAARLRRAVWISDIGEAKELAEASLVTLHSAA